VQRSNLDGQALGRKGAETLKRLMSAAADMLDTTPLRDLRTSDMARRAGISAATFYLYFENVESVVLALADSLIEPAGDLIALAEQPWPPGEDAAILAFVRAYFDFWDKHRSVLRMRNLAAEEGDARFAASRLTISIPLHQAIAAKITAARDRDSEQAIPEDIHDLTLAATILAAMERSASGYRMFPPRFGVSRQRLIAAMVFMIKSVLSGRRPA